MIDETNKKDQEIPSDKTIFSDGIKLQTTVTQASFDSLEKKVIKLEKDLTDAKNNFEKSRFDLITLLGVFVGLITYLGLEIQVFKTIYNPLLIIGISIFFIASILLFILTINVILKKLEAVARKFVVARCVFYDEAIHFLILAI